MCAAPMSSDTSPKRAGPAGPKKKIDDMVEPPSAAVKYLPYALVALVVVSLVGVIMRAPAYATHAAMALLAGGAAALGWVGWSDTHALPPDDGFRRVVVGATGLVAAALVAVAALTLYPGAPAGTVVLRRAGDAGSVTVAAGSKLFVEVGGTFEADVGPSAKASYVLHVTRAGAEEELEGEFERSAGENPMASGNMAGAAATESTAKRHRLRTLEGPGRYTLTLDRMPDNLRPPVRASLYAERLAPWMVSLALGLLALLALVLDAGLAKRGIEPAYAPAMLMGVVLVGYLHRFFAGGNVSEGLFASFLVALLVGGLGGEVIARVTRKVLG